MFKDISFQVVSIITTTGYAIKESIIAGVYNEKTKEFKIPRGNTKIEQGMDLFVITKSELIKKTSKYLRH